MTLQTVLLAVFVCFMISTAHKDIFCLDIYGWDCFSTIITSYDNIRRLFCFFLWRFRDSSRIFNVKNNFRSRSVRIHLFSHSWACLRCHSQHRRFWRRGRSMVLGRTPCPCWARTSRWWMRRNNPLWSRLTILLTCCGSSWNWWWWSCLRAWGRWGRPPWWWCSARTW